MESTQYYRNKVVVTTPDYLRDQPGHTSIWCNMDGLKTVAKDALPVSEKLKNPKPSPTQTLNTLIMGLAIRQSNMVSRSPREKFVGTQTKHKEDRL